MAVCDSEPLSLGLQTSSDAPSSAPRTAVDAVETLSPELGNLNLDEKSEDTEKSDVSTRIDDNVETSDGCDQDLTAIERKVNFDDGKLAPLSEEVPEQKVVATGWGSDDEITAPEETQRYEKEFESYDGVKADGWGWDDEIVGTNEKEFESYDGVKADGWGWDDEIVGTEYNLKTEKESEPWKESKGQSKRPPLFPSRPNEPDCTYYMRTGTCRYGLNCRFNHPPSRLRSKMRFMKPPESLQKSVNENQREFFSGWSGQAESKVVKLSGKKPSSMMVGLIEPEVSYNENKRSQMPFNENKSGTISDGNGQADCKYYSMPGGCKFGASCKYAHKEKTEASVELNFLGLPMRPGQRECTYYMTTGSCKYSVNCRFHHPDPTAVGGQDPSSEYQNGGAFQQHASPAQMPMTSWPLQQNPNEPVPYLDTSSSYLPGYYLPPQGFHLNPEWNGYQAPVNQLFPTEMSMQHPPPVSTRKDTTRKGNVSIPRPLPDGDYPERPGQPECQFFMKTGSCKFKSACKFHHPKSCLPKASVVDLSPVGLPLRPDQPICSHYSRHGICKYGRSCKYNHPTDSNPPASQAADAESNQDKSITVSNGVKTEGSANPVQESEW